MTNPTTNYWTSQFLEGVSDPVVFKALAFAIEKHDGQKRKYTGEPYIVHPIGVAQLVEQHGRLHNLSSKRLNNMIAAAFLHDVVEDCGVTFEQIYDKFGPRIRDLVFWLTDPTKGLSYGSSNYNRKVRKNIAHQFLAEADGDALFVKACDIIHNGKTIFLNDKGFGPVFLEEVMSLYARVKDKLSNYPSLREDWESLPEKARQCMSTLRGSSEEES